MIESLSLTANGLKSRRRFAGARCEQDRYLHAMIWTGYIILLVIYTRCRCKKQKVVNIALKRKAGAIYRHSVNSFWTNLMCMDKKKISLG